MLLILIYKLQLLRRKINLSSRKSYIYRRDQMKKFLGAYQNN
ncbi:TPA: pirin family protein, partial [Escherichia coli]|nr:pirin family protein [Escherichia coli]